MEGNYWVDKTTAAHNPIRPALPPSLPPAINLSYAVISDGATVILINTLSKSARPLSAEAARSGPDTGPRCNMCVAFRF